MTLTYFKEFASKNEALKAEYRFKQLTRKQKIVFLQEEMGDVHVAAEKL